MAEAFRTVSGAIGVVAVTAHTVRSLNDTISGIKGAPTTVQNVKTELENVQFILKSLETALNSEHSGTSDFHSLVQSSNVERTLKTCTDSCANFQEILNNWLKHSNANALDWRDKIGVGFFHEKKLASFTNELSICKETITLALNGTIFLAAVEQNKQLKELVQHNAATHPQNIVAIVPGATPARQAVADDPSISDLKLEAEKVDRLLDGYRELLREILTSAEQRRTNLTMGTIQVDKEGKGIIGIQNADGTEGHLTVDMRDVTISEEAKAVVGYSKGVVERLGDSFWN